VLVVFGDSGVAAQNLSLSDGVRALTRFPAVEILPDRNYFFPEDPPPPGISLRRALTVMFFLVRTSPLQLGDGLTLFVSNRNSLSFHTLER